MYVRVAGPMGCTQYLMSLSWPIGYLYVWHWKGCFHLCSTVILALSIYVWRGRLIVASMLDTLACAMRRALVLEALSSTLVVCCCRCCFVVVAIARRKCVAKWSLCTCAWWAHWRHMLLLQLCCYPSRHCATNMIVLRACTQGFVVCWCYMQRDMKHTRGKLTRYVVVAAVFLSSLLSRDANMKQKGACRQHLLLLQPRYCRRCCYRTLYEVVVHSCTRPRRQC